MPMPVPRQLTNPRGAGDGVEKTGKWLTQSGAVLEDSFVIRLEARFGPSVEPNAEHDRGVAVRGGAEVKCADGFAGARDVIGVIGV